MRITAIPSPLPDWAEDERTYLLGQLAALEQAYRAQAKPFMDALAKLEGVRPPPKMFMRPD